MKIIIAPETKTASQELYILPLNACIEHSKVIARCGTDAIKPVGWTLEFFVGENGGWVTRKIQRISEDEWKRVR